MAAKEMYDYIAIAVPDNDVTLTLSARGEVREVGGYNQLVNIADDLSREVITLSDDPIFYIDYPWNNLNEADSGTIFDFYFDTDKGKGMGKSFKLEYVDGHTYVVMFDTELPRMRKFGSHAITVTFAIIGRIAD